LAGHARRGADDIVARITARLGLLIVGLAGLGRLKEARARRRWLDGGRRLGRGGPDGGCCLFVGFGLGLGLVIRILIPADFLFS
jgi:hypothetical protein